MYRLGLALLCAGACGAQSAQSPQDLLKEAIGLQQAGKFDAAIRDYRQILDKYPDIPEIRSNLGAALAGEGRYSEAIVEYERALSSKPDPQVRLNLALAYYKTTRLTEAIKALQDVRRESPSNFQALTLLADCHLRLGHNKEVISLLDSAGQADSDNPALIYLLGTALVRDGQTARGQVLIDKILKNGDSAEARLLIGTTKYMVGDFSGALADLQKAVELNSSLPDLNSYYGLALLSTGNQADARKAFERELQLNPNNFDANLRMGVLLRQDEENAKAARYLRHALQIRPGDLGVRYQIAALELSEGQVAAAIRDLESILKEAPQFTEAHVSLATAYYREKRKADGDRERGVVAELNAARQANEAAVKAR
jgi:tetratricopeptide (TPR) repeat protein